MTSLTHFESFLGREARSGSWEALAKGTYRVIAEALEEADWDAASALIPVTLLEAEELHDVYGTWPAQIRAWTIAKGMSPEAIAQDTRRLWALIGDGAEPDFEAAWSEYRRLTQAAAALAAEHDPACAELVARARTTWQLAHDQAVDHVYGTLDIAVRHLGEDCLPEVWDHLMSGWYDEHARRLSTANQPWAESARQLAIAIADGFHAHLSGEDRQGDTEFIEERDRIGFRFAPCGSGGRILRDDTTGGRPRPAAPFGFAVTTRPHDWSFGKAGICGYCVHCCLLNMVTPIDRLGYPTRVIEPPTWPEARAGGTCTWWIYRDPSLVPASVFETVGRPAPGENGDERG
jgi:hypothetical protein